MIENIITMLKKIEKEYHVKILFACEAGSRAWGLDSDESDYDVRFIYVHPTEYYLSIDPVGIGKKRDVIELKNQSTLEVSGWELTKSLRLFRNSNPSLLEWLHSPICYFQANSTIDHLKELLPLAFDEKTCVLHYLSMAKSNYYKADKENTINIKTLINILRPLLIAKWIIMYRKFPSMNLEKLVDHFIIISDLRNDILQLIYYKKSGKRNFPFEYNILQYALSEINHLQNSLPFPERSTIEITHQLDQIFHQTLRNVNHSF
ncbi:DNA polymerase beta superfamily protein [Ornithinibacillus sp. 179-J 7C1 HS]|uniref:nucleotidyltransferase domain-containing protein n=1 Tax=Ornithinibacillus sp. 179-J 7C1 HS TaxID=3142384 RepID=UPI0039A03290